MKKVLVIMLLLVGFSVEGVFGETNVGKRAFNEKIFFDQLNILELSFYNSKESVKRLQNTYQELLERKDSSFPLASNQLGSIYLMKGEYDKAFDMFYNASLIMNDMSSAYSELEKKALHFSASENVKMYKGDPYEKMMNSFYLSMLFYRKGDLDNALAVLKTGMLADADSENELYKCDFSLLSTLAARIEALRGNLESSKNYMKLAEDAYKFSCKVNRSNINKEFELNEQIKEQDQALDKYKDKRKLGKVATERLNKLIIKKRNVEDELKKIKETREVVGKGLSYDSISEIIDKDNNVLVFVEIGRGPIKYQTGRYGEAYAFANYPDNIEDVEIYINGNKVNDTNILKDNDLIYQASTRGGREVKSFLKNKVVFKSTTGAVANELYDLSNRFNQNTGGGEAAVYCAVASLVFSAISNATNPAADVRHWRLLPSEVMVLPLKLSPGEYEIIIKYKKKNELKTHSDKVTVNNTNNNIIFERVI